MIETWEAAVARSPSPFTDPWTMEVLRLSIELRRLALD